MSDQEGEELRKRLRLIHFLHQTNPYPQGTGTANQRRNRRRRWRQRWLQILALANRIYSFPDPPANSSLDLAVQQLQGLSIEDLPEPPRNLPTSLSSSQEQDQA
ncbi:rev protein [Simian immunodeficiency virus]|uniref:Protein Rev n=1 Tax=Simian immunodeficiency virus TaxID=11723 RepID=K4MLM1_SIV|nr:rev protein [Simian immunodeficiency virus]